MCLKYKCDTCNELFDEEQCRIYTDYTSAPYGELAGITEFFIEVPCHTGQCEAVILRHVEDEEVE